MTRLEIAARIAAGMVVHRDLTCSEIAEYSLEIADELIKLEAETRPEPKPESEPEPNHESEHELLFEIVVGGVYVMRNGDIDEIVSKDNHDTYPFNGKSGHSYAKNGICNFFNETPHDLIKRIR